MSNVVRGPVWGLGYLRGRVEACRRGRLALSHVAGAVGVAEREGVSSDAIIALLAHYGLRWEPESRAVSRLAEDGFPSATESVAGPATSQE